MKLNWYICSHFKKKRLLNVAVIYFKNRTDNHCLPECCQILILRVKMTTGIAVDVIWFCALKSWLCVFESSLFTLLTCLPCLIWYTACYIVYTMTLVTMEWCGCPGVGSSQIQLYGSVKKCESLSSSVSPLLLGFPYPHCTFAHLLRRCHRRNSLIFKKSEYANIMYDVVGWLTGRRKSQLNQQPG